MKINLSFVFSNSNCHKVFWQAFWFFFLIVNSMCLLWLYDPALKILAASAFSQAFMCPWPVLLNELLWMCLSSFSTCFSHRKNVLTKQLKTDLQLEESLNKGLTFWSLWAVTLRHGSCIAKRELSFLLGPFSCPPGHCKCCVFPNWFINSSFWAGCSWSISLVYY